MQNIRRTATTVLAAALLAVGAGMVTAPPAQAAIRSGWYTYKLYGRDNTVVLTYAAHVVGNKMYATADETWYDIHPTKRGGWVLALDTTRRDFWRVGNGYEGIAYVVHIPRDPTVTSRITLTPR